MRTVQFDSRNIYLEGIVDKAMKIIKQENIPVNIDPSQIKWGRQWKTSWGKTRRTRYGTYSIEINPVYYTHAKSKQCLQTVLHELVHTVQGCFNHGSKWKSIINRINTKYNMDISRCTSQAKAGINLRAV